MNIFNNIFKNKKQLSEVTDTRQDSLNNKEDTKKIINLDKNDIATLNNEKNILNDVNEKSVLTINEENATVEEIKFQEKKHKEHVKENKSINDKFNMNMDDNNYFKKDNTMLKKIIAIANQKGGVGKSTTAVNLTSYLGYFGYKTLIIDIDPQSNSTSGLGIIHDSEKPSIYNIIIGGAEVEKVKIKTEFLNLEIIPSSIQLAGAEVELVTSMKREYKLKEALDKIKNNYDYMIIDCPPALGLLTINALSAADEVIIPIQCEYYALEGLGQLLNTIQLVKNNLNSNLEIAGALMTMYDPRIKLADQVIEEVKKYFSNKIYNTIIPRNVRLSEAPSYGKPILHYDPDCKGAQAYKSFAKEVIKNGTKRIG